MSDEAGRAAGAIGVGSSGRGAQDGQRAGCNGCLKGCGIALLVLVAVVLIGSVAAYAFGRPLLAAQLPHLEVRYPLLTPLLDYSGFRARLVPAQDTQELVQGRVEGTNDRNLVPNDVPLYPEPLEEAYSVGATQVTAYQHVTAAPEDVQAYLSDGFGMQGWALVAERDTGDSVVLGWTKGERSCQVEIIPTGTTTEIWLRGNGAP